MVSTRAKRHAGTATGMRARSLTGHLLGCLALVAIGFWSTAASAQSMAPRAYWPAPKGTNVIVLGYQRSAGDVFTDPSLPVTGVDSTINVAQVTYQDTLSLFGRTASLQFSLPYTWGTTEGFVEGAFRSRNVSALADMQARFAVNLVGAPTMDVAGFQALRAQPRTIIGASVLVQLPIGGYEEDKLINAGTNRWAVKPAVGLIWPIYPTWLLEFELGQWIYGDNDDFLGTTRQQDPIVSSEFHLVKRIRPGFWASLDVNYYTGGRTTVGQDQRADLQENSRIGGTVLFPFKRQHAIRIAFSTGVVTESGGDFNSISVSYLYAWRKKPQ